MADNVLNARFAEDEQPPMDADDQDSPINLLKDGKVDSALRLPDDYRAFAVTASDGEGTIMVQNGENPEEFAYYLLDDSERKRTIYPLYADLQMMTQDNLRWTAFVRVEPVDMTIYMGGADGADGAVNAGGDIVGSASLPEPGFRVNLPGRMSGANVTALTFKEADGNRMWTLVPYDGRTGTTVYKLVPAQGQQPTRVQFTKADGTVIVSDAFEVGREVNTSYSMALYRGAGDTAVGDVVAQYGDESFPVDSSALAELMVRGTTSGEQYAEVKEAAPTDGRIGLTAPANTIYTLNESDIRVDAGSVALLFDDIIEESKESVSRKEALIRRADRALSHTDDERHYELKYLDLVDTDNGNAWVKANGNVTVYWPLPEGTSEETIFTVLHFAGLHREMARDQIMAAIDGCAVEIVDARVKDGYVVFEIGSGGFSPFALVWHTPAGGSLTVSKTVSGDGGERDRDWHFTVTLDDATISGTYGSMTFEQGVSRFTLRHEQHVTAANLPAGMGYTVSEAEANTDGYQTTSVHHVGKIEGKGSITAAFFNQKDSLNIPTTGDAAHPKMWAALGGMALLSIVAMLAMSKRKD